ncbi:MAG: histidine kinase [Clostridia bacterium]|nr:histidine kinase [Clostridia bacterium]
MKKEFIKIARNYGFGSILVRNSIGLFIVFVIIMLIPIIIAENIGLNSVRKEMILRNNEVAGTINMSMELVFRDAEYLTAEIMVNSDVQTYFTSEDEDYLKKYYDVRLSDIMRLSLIGRNNYNSMYICSFASNTVVDSNGIKSMSEFKDAECIEICRNWNNEEYKIFARRINNRYPYLITFIKRTGDGKGFVVVNVDWYQIRKNIININSDVVDYYVVGNNKIIYNNSFFDDNSQNVEYEDLEYLLNSEENYINYKGAPCSISKTYSKLYDYKTICVLSESASVDKFRRIYEIVIIVIVFALMFSLGIAFLLSYNNMDEIIMLTDILDKRIVNIHMKDNEVSAVANRILRILDDNEALKAELNKSVRDYEDLKIKALQAQINSHFMNNTLGVINGEIIKAEGYRSNAGKMVVELSKILNYSFIIDEYLVQLKEELKFADKYMSLLEYRYGHFSHPIIIDGDIENVKIPRMILQVLVENSVFYGRQASMTEIKIICASRGYNVKITVEDNGGGMDEETIKNVEKSFEDDSFTTSKIGLRNVYKRLKLIYRDAVTMYIESERDKYTRIIIEIQNDI